MNYTSSSAMPSRPHRHITPPLLTSTGHRLWPSLSVTRYLSSPTIFEPLDHPRNSQRNTSALSKLLPRQVPTCSPSSCLIACTPSTQSSTSLCYLYVRTFNPKLVPQSVTNPGPSGHPRQRTGVQDLRILDSKINRHRKCKLQYLCEGDAADEATIIDYSKTGANKR